VSIDIDVQIATDAADIPPAAELRRWAAAAIGGRRPRAELGIRIVDANESRELNQRYRQCDRPTNVLSFAADLPPDLELAHLGDLLICQDVVRREAGEQGKPLLAHWAHMVVHGTLHLLGYDHVFEQAANEMEALEVQILTGLGYSDPYLSEPRRDDQPPPADNECNDG